MNHWDIKNITLFDKRYNDGGAASRYQQLDFDRGTDIHSSNVAVTRRVTGARPSRRSQMETPTTLRMRWPDLKPGSGAAAISAGTTTTTRQKGSPLLRANNTRQQQLKVFGQTFFKGILRLWHTSWFYEAPITWSRIVTAEQSEEKRKRWMGHKRFGDKSRTEYTTGVLQEMLTLFFSTLTFFCVVWTFHHPFWWLHLK